MFSSRGKQLLMVDADGATKFSDFTKVQSSLHKIINGKVCAIWPFMACIQFHDSFVITQVHHFKLAKKRNEHTFSLLGEMKNEKINNSFS